MTGHRLLPVGRLSPARRRLHGAAERALQRYGEIIALRREGQRLVGAGGAEADENAQHLVARSIEDSAAGGADAGVAIEGELARAFGAGIERLADLAILDRHFAPAAPILMASRDKFDFLFGRDQAAKSIGLCA